MTSHKLTQKQKEFFQIPQKTFTYIGIDPLAQHAGFIIKHPFICYGFYTVTFIFVLAAIDFCIKNVHDTNEFTVAVSLLNQLVIALWKITIFFGKRCRIHKLINNIWQWNEKAEDGCELEILSKLSSKNSLLSKFYYTIVFSTGCLGLLMPLIIKLLKFLRGVEGMLQVPHKASYFWNTSNVAGYTAAYIWNLIIIHFLINASVAIDTFFMWSILNIRIRFRILKQRFEMIAAKQENEILFGDRIKDNIKFHLHILYLGHELDSIFREIIFVKSLISCTQICFLAFGLIQKDTAIVDLLHPFIFLLAVSMQLILYCYNGHLIEEQSLMVSKDVFAAFDWSRLSVAKQKMLQMVMLRSQKSSHVTGIFFNLNMSLYLWFFKTAGSLIAALKTLEDDK